MPYLLAFLSGLACAALTAFAMPHIYSLMLKIRHTASRARAGFAGGGGLVERLVRGHRIGKMREQLSGALMTLSSSVRAGLSLPQAVGAAGARIPAPLGTELVRVSEELALGGSMDTAMRNLERRVPVPEMGMLVAGLELSRTTGASLAPLLDRLAETIREREQLRGQLRTMTAQGRLSGWVVGSVPLVLLVAMGIIDPDFVRPLFQTPAGWLLLGVAAVLEAAGALTIRMIVRVGE